MITIVKGQGGYEGMLIGCFGFQIIAIITMLSLIFKDFHFDYEKKFREAYSTLERS
jgi:hypothetical protein